MRTILASLLCLLFLIALPLAAEDRAICGVCGPREGAGPEPVKATATYQGKQYFFCSLECKVEFLKNPQEFLVTDVGTDAPAFRLTTFDGSEVSLDDYRGKVVLLDFWATFCPPCIQALPELQALHQKHSSHGLAILGVTIDDREALVRKATGRAKVTYPILRGTAEVWNAYKVNSLPTLILVGRDGTILRRYGGEADKKAMLAEIEHALTTSTAEAR